MTTPVPMLDDFERGWAAVAGDRTAHFWITVPEGNTGYRLCRKRRLVAVRGRARDVRLIIPENRPGCKRCRRMAETQS